MNFVRHGLLALLALLQLLAPYLHTHASASVAGGLHVHLPSVAGPPAGAAVQRDSAVDPGQAPNGFAVAQRHAFGPAGESPALEMPVEWRRDQPMAVAADTVVLPARLPPVPRRVREPLPPPAAAPPSRLAFALLAYPAAAPPAGSAHC